MKPKLPQPETPNQIRDDFQIPRYATGLILSFVPSDVDVIWECCSGEGRMADVICEWLASGQSINWLVYRTDDPRRLVRMVGQGNHTYRERWRRVQDCTTRQTNQLHHSQRKVWQEVFISIPLYMVDSLLQCTRCSACCSSSQRGFGKHLNQLYSPLANRF